jgi:hypothetical protein
VTPEYQQFLSAKTPKAKPSGMEPGPMPAHLFDFQADCVEFSLRQGRAAMFLDTGLGKTRIQLEWCHQAAETSLILTPLAVARQIEREGLYLGYNARVIRDQSQVRPGINICNYDRLDLLDASKFGAVSLDESSILKSFTGATTRKLIAFLSGVRFRLCATATPAPNDHMELGQHAEALGIMPSNEMLMRWFTADQTQMGRYRLNGHGEADFWDWMASWACCAETPADLGYDASRFVLPPLQVIRHKASGDIRAPAGTLFMEDLSATNIHEVKRQTAKSRAEAVGSLVRAEPSEPWVIWCDTDYEADELKRCLPDAVEVRGSHTPETKEARLADFSEGRARLIITKPSVAGMGMNWQHAARVAFVGRSFSYEAWYQAVRRCHRFGQTRSVTVHLIVAEGEDQIGRVINRKAGDHAAMKKAMASAMLRRRETKSNRVAYLPTHEGTLPTWLQSAA